MTIVIIIVGIIFGMGSNFFRGARGQFVYNNSLQDAVNIIKTARNFAITSRAAFDGVTSQVPPEGYGVYINRPARQIILFANTAIAGDERNQYNAGSDLIEEQLDFPQETEFISMTSDTGTPNEAVIIFRPPLADAFLSNNGDPNMAINLYEEITMEFRRLGAPATATKEIIFNRTKGFPEVQL